MQGGMLSVQRQTRSSVSCGCRDARWVFGRRELVRLAPPFVARCCGPGRGWLGHRFRRRCVGVCNRGCCQIGDASRLLCGRACSLLETGGWCALSAYVCGQASRRARSKKARVRAAGIGWLHRLAGEGLVVLCPGCVAPGIRQPRGPFSAMPWGFSIGFPEGIVGGCSLRGHVLDGSEGAALPSAGIARHRNFQASAR